jgi:hypothetical protein
MGRNSVFYQPKNAFENSLIHQKNERSNLHLKPEFGCQEHSVDEIS